MRASVVIPARMGSTRFPGKVLAPLDSKPIIQHVYERSKSAKGIDEVIVATDSHEVLAAVEAFGGRAVMTSDAHTSGTDRVAEAAAPMDCDIIVNVQGDEPLIRPEVIEMTVGLLEDGRAAISTVASKITSPEDLNDINVVKVVMDLEGFALYFSRSAIPCHRDHWGKGGFDGDSLGGLEADFYRHIGIYGYRRDVLLAYTKMQPTGLERAEKLEQLRALENGLRIKVGVTSYESIGVDTPEDLERVRKCLSTSL